MAMCFDFLKSECFIFYWDGRFCFYFYLWLCFSPKSWKDAQIVRNVRFVSMLNQAHGVYMYIYRNPDLKGNDELLEQVLCLSSFFFCFIPY